MGVDCQANPQEKEELTLIPCENLWMIATGRVRYPACLLFGILFRRG
jgi:hypothetical protein